MEATTYPIGICPVSGVGWSKVEDIDIDVFTIPVGVGIGGAIQTANNLRVIPAVIPQLLVIHARGFDDSVTETEFGVDLGVTLAGDNAFVGFSVSVTSIDDSDPSFGIAAGAIF